MLRKSLEDVKHMVEFRFYTNQHLPDELIPYHVYLKDTGHCIMCVLECHLPEISDNYDDYELPVPVKYVLEKGYRMQDNYVIVDAEYDMDFGLLIDDEYIEV